MTNEELDAIIESFRKRSDPAYTTPSGAFLDLLRDYAGKLDIEAFAEACSLYTSKLAPESRQFISHRVPGILCNWYFTKREDLNYTKFIKYTVNNIEWATPLRDNFNSPQGLKNSIEHIIQSIAASA